MAARATIEPKSIAEWLEGIPDSTVNPRSSQFDHHASKKRKYHHHPLSPPASLSASRCTSDNMASPLKTPKTKQKKRKVDAANHDSDPEGNEEETPTQPSRLMDIDNSDAFSLSSASMSQTSNKSSPAKLFPQLSLAPQGLKRVPMDLRDPNLPNDLVDLIIEMQAICRGRGVVPTSLKSTIEERKRESRANYTLYSEFDDSVYGPDDGFSTEIDNLLNSALQTVDAAVDCDATQQDETGWNHLVHSPLLDAVLGRIPRNLVGFAPCMTANITSRYKIPSAPGARVDYAMFANPVKDKDPALGHAIENLQRRMPDASINHTPFTPFSKRPISVSIETKRQNGEGDKAVLQIGIWQAAQWNLLSELTGLRIEALSFIPGIVVEGHEWKLVATTHKEGKTVLWTSQLFGNTLSPLGSFQAMAGVRRLRRWTAETYWPWYKRYVLKLGPREAPELPV